MGSSFVVANSIEMLISVKLPFCVKLLNELLGDHVV